LLPEAFCGLKHVENAIAARAAVHDCVEGAIHIFVTDCLIDLLSWEVLASQSSTCTSSVAAAAADDDDDECEDVEWSAVASCRRVERRR